MESSVSLRTSSAAKSLPPMRKSRKRRTGDSIYHLGIDPGYKQTGLVLRQGKQILEYILLTDSLGTSSRTIYRSRALAACVGDSFLTWAHSYDIVNLEVGLEKPIYNRNTVTFEKQISLFYLIEYELLTWARGYGLTGMPRNWYITEFIPSESKYAATGNGAADKAEVLAASPFTPDLALMDKDSWETMGDAWAASLVPRHDHEGRFRLE